MAESQPIIEPPKKPSVFDLLDRFEGDYKKADIPSELDETVNMGVEILISGRNYKVRIEEEGEGGRTDYIIRGQGRTISLVGEDGTETVVTDPVIATGVLFLTRSALLSKSKGLG